MLIPIAILGFGSLVVGALWSPVLGPFGTVAFQSYLNPVLDHAQSYLQLSLTPKTAVAVPVHGHGSYWPMIAGLLAAFAGFVVALLIWRRGHVDSKEKDLVGFAAWWTWGFDRVYHVTVILPTKITAWIMAWIVDALVAGVVGLTADVARFLGDGYTSIQRPRLRSSLALSASGAVGLVSLVLLTGPIAWVVGLTALSVAIIFLLLEFLF
jgi:hypothetical protein